MRSNRTPLWGQERAVLGVPREASRAEVEGDRFAVLDIAVATGCLGRAENRVGVSGAGIWPRPKGKGQGRAPAGSHWDESVLGLVDGWLGLVAAVARNAGRPMQEIRGGSWAEGLSHRRVQMRGHSPWF